MVAERHAGDTLACRLCHRRSRSVLSIIVSCPLLASSVRPRATRLLSSSSLQVNVLLLSSSLSLSSFHFLFLSSFPLRKENHNPCPIVWEPFFHCVLQQFSQASGRWGESSCFLCLIPKMNQKESETAEAPRRFSIVCWGVAPVMLVNCKSEASRLHCGGTSLWE